MLNWITQLQSYFQSVNNVGVLFQKYPVSGYSLQLVLYEVIGPLFQSRVLGFFDLPWFLALLQNG